MTQLLPCPFQYSYDPASPDGDFSALALVDDGRIIGIVLGEMADALLCLLNTPDTRMQALVDAATEHCDEMARDGYQNAKLESVRALRKAIGTFKGA